MSVVASPICTPKSEKYKINSFLSKINTNEYADTDVIIDAAEIAVVLQTIGFKLLRFEKVIPEYDDNEMIKENNDLLVSITCGKSGLKTVLARQDYECNCTNIKLSKKQEECQTEISNEICNKEEFKLVLPKISSKDLSLTKDVLSYIFFKNKSNDINQNEEEVQTPLGKFPVNHHEENNDDKKQDDNWEVDPKTSPPTLTSSPIPQKTEEPLNSDKDIILEQVLSEAKMNIEKALSFISKNNTFTKRNVKRVSNIAKIPQSPRTPRRASISTCNETATIKRPNTPKTYPSPLNNITRINSASNVMSVKITPKLEKRPLLPSRIGSLRKTAEKNLSDDKKKTFIRSDTPRPGSVTPKTQIKCPSTNLVRNGNLNQPINKHNIEKTKSPLMKAKSTLPSLSKIPNFAYKKLTSNK